MAGLTKEQRRAKEIALGVISENDVTLVDTAVAETPTPKPTATAKKLDLGENKQYTRYSVFVTPHMQTFRGLQMFDRYEIVLQQKLLTNVRIEPKRAKQLNTKVHDTKQYLVEDGQRIPIKMIRRLREDGDTEIDGGFVDTFIYE